MTATFEMTKLPVEGAWFLAAEMFEKDLDLKMHS